jgi:hypothetical protein
VTVGAGGALAAKADQAPQPPNASTASSAASFTSVALLDVLLDLNRPISDLLPRLLSLVVVFKWPELFCGAAAAATAPPWLCYEPCAADSVSVSVAPLQAS